MDLIGEILPILALLGTIVGFFFVLFRKAGYETRIALLMAVGMLAPFINFGIFIYFLLARWPVQTELASLRRQAGIPTREERPCISTQLASLRRKLGMEAKEDVDQKDPTVLLSAALKLESQGSSAAAVAKYEEVIRNFPGSEVARDAEISLRSLSGKLGDN